MKLREKLELLIDDGQTEALQIQSIIEEKYNYQIVSPSKGSLVMIKVRETAHNSLFYLGEVLVTETKVKIDGQIGIGLVKGNDRSLSLALAIIDAYYKLNPEKDPRIESIFQKIKHKRKERIKHLSNLLALTKVNFDTLNG